ncbi:efflux transporter periplasmic adaptor subunit, partial [Pseudomonas aeruginosa]|nr:efflux transporter periplasmic adaptor subunit [Pseudomonas aeruginosa]
LVHIYCVLDCVLLQTGIVCTVIVDLLCRDDHASAAQAQVRAV